MAMTNNDGKDKDHVVVQLHGPHSLAMRYDDVKEG
jgi:hypothetical protein